MTDTLVLVMASGHQRRFESSEHKQMLMVGAETLLKRMIRQVNERIPADIRVITHHPAIAAHVGKYALDLGDERGEKLSGSMAATWSMWRPYKRLIILLGDVYYTELVMSSIMLYDVPHVFYGDRWDTFACAIQRPLYGEFIQACRKANTDRKGKLRKVYQAYVDVSMIGNSFEPAVQRWIDGKTDIYPDAVWSYVGDETRDFDRQSDYHNFVREVLCRKELP